MMIVMMNFALARLFHLNILILVIADDDRDEEFPHRCLGQTVPSQYLVSCYS